MTPYAPGAFLRLRAEAPGARGARIALRIIIIPCIAIFVGGLLYAFVSALLHQ